MISSALRLFLFYFLFCELSASVYHSFFDFLPRFIQRTSYTGKENAERTFQLDVRNILNDRLILFVEREENVLLKSH